MCAFFAFFVFVGCIFRMFYESKNEDFLRPFFFAIFVFFFLDFHHIGITNMVKTITLVINNNLQPVEKDRKNMSWWMTKI